MTETLTADPTTGGLSMPARAPWAGHSTRPLFGLSFGMTSLLIRASSQSLMQLAAVLSLASAAGLILLAAAITGTAF